MVFLGVGEGSKSLLRHLVHFFPILLSTAAGVRQINPILTQVATNYGANRFKLFTRVVLPGSLPSVLTGVLLALNLTLLLTVAIEIITAKEGLGSIIWFSWQNDAHRNDVRQSHRFDDSRSLVQWVYALADAFAYPGTSARSKTVSRRKPLFLLQVCRVRAVRGQPPPLRQRCRAC